MTETKKITLDPVATEIAAAQAELKERKTQEAEYETGLKLVRDRIQYLNGYMAALGVAPDLMKLIVPPERNGDVTKNRFKK